VTLLTPDHLGNRLHPPPGSDPAAFLPQPRAALRRRRSRRVCSTCGTPLPNLGPPPAPSARRHGRALPDPATDIPAGTSVLLLPGPCRVPPGGRGFAGSITLFPAAHATVQWMTPGTPHQGTRYDNGTYSNDDRVLPGAEVPTVDGGPGAAAADVTGNVSRPQGGPGRTLWLSPQRRTFNGAAPGATPGTPPHWAIAPPVPLAPRADLPRIMPGEHVPGSV